MTLSWPAKFGDELLQYEYDWVDMLGDQTITGEPTVTFTGSASLELDRAPVTTGTVTVLWIKGGGLAANPGAAVNLLATMSNGEKIGDRVKLPIKARGTPA